jgi:hypothetical protein
MMVIAQNVQDMIDNCLQFHAQYLGQATAAGSCRINRDFIGARLEPQEIQSTAAACTLQAPSPKKHCSGSYQTVRCLAMTLT